VTIVVIRKRDLANRNDALIATRAAKNIGTDCGHMILPLGAICEPAQAGQRREFSVARNVCRGANATDPKREEVHVNQYFSTKVSILFENLSVSQNLLRHVALCPQTNTWRRLVDSA
jgi:hypothetical protein